MSLTGVNYRFCVIDVSHHLFASLSDIRLRRNSEFPEEDLVFVTMKSENSPPQAHGAKWDLMEATKTPLRYTCTS